MLTRCVLRILPADVGGGAVTNKEPTYLVHIPPRWMARKCFNCNSGIVFDACMLQTIGLPVYCDACLRLPMLAPLYTCTAGGGVFPGGHRPVPPGYT